MAITISRSSGLRSAVRARSRRLAAPLTRSGRQARSRPSQKARSLRSSRNKLGLLRNARRFSPHFPSIKQPDRSEARMAVGMEASFVNFAGPPQIIRTPGSDLHLIRASKSRDAGNPPMAGTFASAPPVHYEASVEGVRQSFQNRFQSDLSERTTDYILNKLDEYNRGRLTTLPSTHWGIMSYAMRDAWHGLYRDFFSLPLFSLSKADRVAVQKKKEHMLSDLCAIFKWLEQGLASSQDDYLKARFMLPPERCPPWKILLKHQIILWRVEERNRCSFPHIHRLILGDEKAPRNRLDFLRNVLGGLKSYYSRKISKGISVIARVGNSGFELAWFYYLLLTARKDMERIMKEPDPQVAREIRREKIDGYIGRLSRELIRDTEWKEGAIQRLLEMIARRSQAHLKFIWTAIDSAREMPLTWEERFELVKRVYNQFQPVYMGKNWGDYYYDCLLSYTLLSLGEVTGETFEPEAYLAGLFPDLVRVLEEVRGVAKWKDIVNGLLDSMPTIALEDLLVAKTLPYTVSSVIHEGFSVRELLILNRVCALADILFMKNEPYFVSNSFMTGLIQEGIRGFKPIAEAVHARVSQELQSNPPKVVPGHRYKDANLPNQLLSELAELKRLADISGG